LNNNSTFHANFYSSITGLIELFTNFCETRFEFAGKKICLSMMRWGMH